MTDRLYSPEPWREGRVGGVIVGGPRPTPCVDCESGWCYGHWALVHRLGRPADLDAYYARYYGGDLIAESLGASDRRRILACVNACAGIPTEVLEAGLLTSLRDRLLGIAGICGASPARLALPERSGDGPDGL